MSEFLTCTWLYLLKYFRKLKYALIALQYNLFQRNGEIAIFVKNYPKVLIFINLLNDVISHIKVAF